MPRPGYYYYQNQRAKNGIIVFLGLLCVFGVYRLFSSDYILVLARYIQAYRIKALLLLGACALCYWFLGLIRAGKRPSSHMPQTYAAAYQYRQPDVVGEERDRAAGSSAFRLMEPRFSDTLYNIDPFGFEKLVANLLRLEGEDVQELGEEGPDGGVDLVMKREVPVAVQCKKHYVENIGVAALRELVGAMTDLGYSQGLFVTFKGYTGAARSYAARNNISLWSLSDIKRRIAKHSKNLDGETSQLLKAERYACSSCDEFMIILRIKSEDEQGHLIWKCRCCNATFAFLKETDMTRQVANS